MMPAPFFMGSRRRLTPGCDRWSLSLKRSGVYGWLLCWLLSAGAGCLARAAELAPPTAESGVVRVGVRGMELGEMRVGAVTYRGVQVRSMDGRSLVFMHTGGLTSVRLRDLPAGVQARLGLDSSQLLLAEQEAPPPSRVVSRRAGGTREVSAIAVSGGESISELLPRLTEPPVLRGNWSLRDEFTALQLGVKDQGRRPSCAIFAVVGALEFQMARSTGRSVRLSEEYLIWAVRRAQAGAVPVYVTRPAILDAESEADIGFTLPEVITAVQMFGLAEYADMPNRFGIASSEVPPPTEEVIERARNRRRVSIIVLPGAKPQARMAAIVHALHAGYPVPVGLRWPNERSIPAGVLSDQTPLQNGAHAVTIVGYEVDSGRPDDVVFVFKNSYGPRWGQGGYGRVAARYLERNLLDAYVLESRLF